MKNSTKYSQESYFVKLLKEAAKTGAGIIIIFMAVYLIWFFGYAIYTIATKRRSENRGEFADYMQIPVKYQEPAFLFSPKKFWQALVKSGVKHPEIVYAQARLETGNFKSHVFIKYNNAFGFRTNDNYLRFDTWMACVEYKKRWQERKYKGGDYYAFLTTYAEDSNYVEKVRRLVNDGIAG